MPDSSSLTQRALSRFFRRVRACLGLRIEELAELTGIPQGTLRAVEQGLRSAIDLLTVYQFTHAFDMCALDAFVFCESGSAGLLIEQISRYSPLHHAAPPTLSGTFAPSNYSEFFASLCSTFLRIREGKGVSAYSLAQSGNLGLQTIRAIETQKRMSIETDTLLDLAYSLEVSPVEVLRKASGRIYGVETTPTQSVERLLVLAATFLGDERKNVAFASRLFLFDQLFPDGNQ